MNVNQLITRADIPNLTTVFGNLGNSWNNALPNDLFIKGVPKVIYRDQANPKLTNGGNVGGGLDTIFTFTLPDDGLKSDGDIFDVWAGGTFASNDNDKRLVNSFGGNQFEDTGLRDLDTNVGWSMYSRIQRIDSTHVRWNSSISENAIGADSAQVLVAFNTGSVLITRDGFFTVNNMNTNTNDFLIRAEATANDDVTITQVVITLTRFS